MSGVLSSPRLYSLVQEALGATAVRRFLLERYVQPATGERILDLGCGPGDTAGLLPAVQYTGIDLSRRYVEAARRRHAGHGRRFLEGDVRRLEEQVELGRFDAVISIGLLHHLADREADALLAAVGSLLGPQGRFVTLDPGVHDGQSRIAAWLVGRDRGHHVRRPEEYEQLLAPYFRRVEATLHTDLARVPYSHVVVSCREPILADGD